MRLFIASALPVAVKDVLSAHQDALRQALPHEQRSVRWVAPPVIHLTLQFLGEAELARVASILVTLQRVIQADAELYSAAPLGLHLDTLGGFPNLTRPQVLWAGVGGDIARLGALQQRLSAALEPLGFAPEQRPFSPHLTLGRVRREAPAAHQFATGAAVRALPPLDPTPWNATPPALFESTLTPHGPIYTQLS